MKKKNFKALLFSLCLCALAPQSVIAKEKEENFTLDVNEWLEKIDELENRMIRNKIPIYKQESLWLITDTPNVDPNEERNYYFIDKNNAKIKLTTYYDDNENKLEDVTAATIKYEQKSYLPITLKDKSFVVCTTYNLKTNSVITNFLDFDMEYYWEEEIPVEYGRFVDVSTIIPKEMQKEKYSAYDLEKILEIINDPEYEIFMEPLTREIK